MEFIGPADYYFWNGVLCGLVAHKNEDPDEWIPQFYMNNETTRGCQDAFTWGFCFGLVISEEEYAELTLPPKEDKMIVTEPEELREKPNPAIIGNC